MADKDLFGYGTGYVPQIDEILQDIDNHLPDVIFDHIMGAVIKDAKKQGIELDDTDDDDAQDLLMETVSEVAFTFVAKIREAAKSSDEDELHFMLLPF